MQEAIYEQIRFGNFDKAHELERDLAVTDKQNERMPEGWVPDLTDTQCVDSEGNPLTVFHGTPVDFADWDENFTGNGEDAFGSGFYFTTSEDTAAGYGGVTKKVKLDIKNPIVINGENVGEAREKLHITPDQVVELFKNIPNIYTTGDLNEDNPLGDLSEEYWNKETLTGREVDDIIGKVVKQHFANGTDMNDLERYYENSGGAKTFRKALRKVTGHDGVVAHFPSLGQSHWIAWSANQIVDE